jgi:acyl carrier protein
VHEDWPRFARDIATLARLPAEEVRPEARLVQDLALDSVALSELVVILIDDYRMTRESPDLVQRSWDGVTAGELFQEYLASTRG